MTVKKINSYFNIYPGLNLIENPKVSKHNRKWFNKSTNKSPNISTSKSQNIQSPDFIMDNYKNLLNDKINTLNHTFNKCNDFYSNLIKTGYYYYINQKKNITTSHNYIYNEIIDLMEFIIINTEFISKI